MIIDSHSHLKHGNREATEYRPHEIVAVLDEAGIDRAVVFAISCTTAASMAMGRRAIQGFPDRLSAYVFVDPSYHPLLHDLVDQAIAELGFAGVKIHLGQGIPPIERLTDFVQQAGRLQVPCVIDFAGRDDILADLAPRCPDTALLVAHFGKYLCDDPAWLDRFFAIADDHPHLHLDASGVVLDDKYLEAVDRFGPDRVLFGIDGPHPLPTCTEHAQAAVAQVGRLGLGEAEMGMVMGGNMVRLLGL